MINLGIDIARQKVKERQNYMCRCGREINHIHHINKKRWDNSLRNLEGLCNWCHASRHPKRFTRIAMWPNTAKKYRWYNRWKKY